MPNLVPPVRTVDDAIAYRNVKFIIIFLVFILCLEEDHHEYASRIIPEIVNDAVSYK